MTYNEELKARATALVARKALHLDVDTVDVFADIDWHQAEANDAYFASLVTGKVITTKALATKRQTVRRNYEIAAEIGGVPHNESELVELQAKALDVKVDWNGVFRTNTTIENVLDFAQYLRVKSNNLKLGFRDRAIDDAADYFYKEAKRARAKAVDEMLSTRVPFDWEAFATAFFKTTDTMSLEVNVATVKKWVHQVRRKLRGLPVTHHIMPVVHGPQGCGKTFMLQHMLAPLAEATAWSDFDQVTDVRNIQLWNSLVIVLDEMAKAAKTDIETVKHVITAEALDRRPMGTNNMINVRNRATLIGATNHRLDEIIRDETGNRRFVELIYRTDGDRDAIKAFDFSAMWRSVQPEDADSMEEYRDQLKAAQAELATLGPVEDWLLNSASSIWAGEADTSTLYQAFKAHRAEVTSGIDYQSRTQNTFSSELRRVTSQNAAYGVCKVRKNAGMRWTRDVELTPAQQKAREIVGTNLTLFPRGEI